jgi:hypothetical protein
MLARPDVSPLVEKVSTMCCHQSVSDVLSPCREVGLISQKKFFPPFFKNSPLLSLRATLSPHWRGEGNNLIVCQR